MKGIWEAIAYFVLYFGLTMILQVLLSIVFWYQVNNSHLE